MTLRRLSCLAIALGSALVGINAHGSYVIEADGADMNGGAIAAGADFDFVTHDFGIESGEAIQIALTHLSSVPNLHGNLLFWSVGRNTEEPNTEEPNTEEPIVEEPVADLSAADSGVEGSSVAIPTPTKEFVPIDGGEDFSYYDTGTAASGEDLNGFGVNAATPTQSLPASLQSVPAFNTSTLFWILKPAEFTSFSQMMAARFGF